MPKKIRELKAMLRQSGWYLVPGGGKGSHTKWRHPKFAAPSHCRAVTVTTRNDTRSGRLRRAYVRPWRKTRHDCPALHGDHSVVRRGPVLCGFLAGVGERLQDPRF